MLHRSVSADHLSEADTVAVTVDTADTVTTETAAARATAVAVAVRVISAVICGVRIRAASAWVEISAPAADHFYRIVFQKIGLIFKWKETTDNRKWMLPHDARK